MNERGFVNLSSLIEKGKSRRRIILHANEERSNSMDKTVLKPNFLLGTFSLKSTQSYKIPVFIPEKG